MEARQLPKLETRGRCPSPAPKIQPTLVVGFIFGLRRWKRTRQKGSGRQLTRTSIAQFESYVAKGAHRATANMGIRHSLRPHQEFNRPYAGLIIGLRRRKRTRQKSSEQSESEDGL